MEAKRKIPISGERIQKAMKMLSAGDQNGAIRQMRKVRKSLERYEKRLTNG